jgi:LEA14-like dessication related protein
MKTRHIFIALLLFSFGFIACKKPQSFDYRDIRNVRVEKAGFDRSTIAMDLVYFNPNNFGVQLKHVDCDVYVEKTFLGKFTLDTTMNILKKSEFVLPAKIDVDMKNIFKNTFSALFGTELLVEVKGTTRVGKGGIFINVPVDYSGRHKFELFKTP